jgi:DNA repair exonuclease SbcCD ATPase subunit
MYNQDANARDYQKYLEQQILKLNYRSFTQVVILGSSTFIPFMQLKARHRREVVEEILDIQIFSIMNLLLKQKLKDIFNDLRELDYEIELVEEKISLQQKYISEMKENKKKLLVEKNVLVNGNEEEIFKRQAEIDLLNKENDELIASIDDKTSLDNKLSKLNDIKSTLLEKHRTHSRLIGFFEKNEDCPTCQQHIDENFKEDMITNKQKVNLWN